MKIKIMKQYYLTKHLYSFDQVIFSLIGACISKENIYECVFWFLELYRSGYEIMCCAILIRIYYDFYAIHYPSFELTITSLLKKWMGDNNVEHLVKLLVNLFHKKPNGVVYFMRLNKRTTNEPRKKRGRWPILLNTIHFDRTHPKQYYKKTIRALYDYQEKPSLVNASRLVFYINELWESDKKAMYDVVTCYIKNVLSLSSHRIDVSFELFKHPLFLDPAIGKLYKPSLEYHALLASVFTLLQVNLGFDYTEISQRKKVINLTSEMKDFMNICFTENEVNYTTLSKMRIFNISPCIYYFDYVKCNKRMVSKDSIERNDSTCEDDVIKNDMCNVYEKIIFRDHWLYYARNTPFWKKIINDDGCDINDLNMGNFIGGNDLEPDEQTAETALKSMIPYRQLPNGEWIEKHFGVWFKMIFKDYDTNRFDRKVNYLCYIYL